MLLGLGTSRATSSDPCFWEELGSTGSLQLNVHPWVSSRGLSHLRRLQPDLMRSVLRAPLSPEEDTGGHSLDMTQKIPSERRTLQGGGMGAFGCALGMWWEADVSLNPREMPALMELVMGRNQSQLGRGPWSSTGRPRDEERMGCTPGASPCSQTPQTRRASELPG